ncbi:DoxX family protein [Streptomyces sp. NPDC002133]|uniref:DoxX family protein n=1 Tax=Streptomyces sp. NPDC002133 TaxID=3154409 RepID=UPI00331DFB1F
MSTAYVVVTLLAGAIAGFSAGSAFLRASWLVQPVADHGIPRSWWPWLGTSKAAGATGLPAGLFVTVIGVTAGIGPMLHFTGAVVTVIRARW